MREKLIPILLLFGTFSLIYNPFTKFPFTFLLIIIVILIVTYVQEGTLKGLYFKTIMASEISSQYPEHRVLKLIDYFKIKKNKLPKETNYMVEITRQQIADLTGLRVETVIRAIKSLEKKGEVTIKDRKVYR